ncbi:hypothetical protein ACPW7J_09465 [Ihubacter sp. rT4E-8]|uniref:hypothetical protein n=1 Tax=Ihubacter sp. rT4E-8 TaxID=3242369 RepID=UPI003CF378CB
MLEKITKQMVSANNVKSIPGQRLTGTVSENKHVFDKFPELISVALNSIIDALQSVADGDSGADCINITPIDGMSGTTVQDILNTFKSMLDDVYTKGSIDDKLEDKADKQTVNMSLKEISLDPDTGIWTFVRQNGTSFTIDTLLEKILVGFKYDKTTQSIIFTASDGTQQPVSLSDFITDTEFVSSDTIEVKVENGVVSAHIKAGGISDDLLSSALKATLIGYKDAAQTAATNAAASETNAGQYASRAAGSANAAAQKATDAIESAANASESANNADTYAKKSQSYAVGGTNSRSGEDTDNSRYYKEQAAYGATAAAESASIAQNASDVATNKANDAKVSENAAKSAALTATEKATAAGISATNAANSEEAAAGNATIATQKASAANASATNAANSAAAAENSKNAAAGSASAAQAAKEAAEQARDEAQGIAGGDYATSVALKQHTDDSDLHFSTVEKEKLSNVPENTRTALEKKVDKETGKGLSTNDYTTAEKSKVANLPANTNTALSGKVDKEKGKGLSANDYTTLDKNKVGNLPENTNTVLASKANKSAINLSVLSAAAWDTSNSTYSFENTYPVASNDLSVEPDSTCTPEQIDAWNAARIIGSSSSNILKAFGEIPAIDIPIILEVRTK